ncbi:interleukin-15 receptor subunit alpha isoform X1 [Gadus morhua]|uniref:interleukin-15 receptor subunit alpha isoform X1 n=1 Tax=Gadus morhua TaxID=8049 RepID=UPI0011B59D8F|nr:interleukin-15 receptor subunit alpha isoform X1 [Gadus morhua]
MSIRCPHALCASGGLGWCSERLLLLLLLLLLSACLLEVATVGPGGTSRKVPCECNNCPQLPTLNLTEAPAALNCCTNGGRFRYKCVVNHVRKAGTSNLAACTSENGIGTWSKPNLVCIPDPRIVITTKPPDVNPTSHAAVPRPDEGTPGAQGVPSSGAAVPTGLGLAALILISAILGFSFCCWRRKRSANCPTGSAEPTPPEEMPLNPTNPPPPSGSAPPGPPS